MLALFPATSSEFSFYAPTKYVVVDTGLAANIYKLPTFNVLKKRSGEHNTSTFFPLTRKGLACWESHCKGKEPQFITMKVSQLKPHT